MKQKLFLMSRLGAFGLRQCLLFPALLSQGSELLHNFVHPIQPKLVLDFCFAAVIRPAFPKQDILGMDGVQLFS